MIPTFYKWWDGGIWDTYICVENLSFVVSRAVAVDMRAYSESDKPPWVHQYRMEHLVSDTRDLIRDLGTNVLFLFIKFMLAPTIAQGSIVKFISVAPLF